MKHTLSWVGVQGGVYFWKLLGGCLIFEFNALISKIQISVGLRADHTPTPVSRGGLSSLPQNNVCYEGKFFMILVIKRRNILASTLFCFHQIFKQGQNIKIEIWKCPIKVELVKKSSHRGGTSL